MAGVPLLSSLAQPADAGGGERERPFGLPNGFELFGLRRQLEAALRDRDRGRLHALLEPLVRDVAGGEWQLEVVAERGTCCASGERKILLGVPFPPLENKFAFSALAFDVEISILHEIGHALYTGDFLRHSHDRRLAAAAAEEDQGVSIARLEGDRRWLDNIFADARLRARLREEHPEYTNIVDWDVALTFGLTMAAAYHLSGAGAQIGLDDFSRFKVLPPQEQAGVLAVAALNGMEIEKEFLGLAVPAARTCFVEMQPLLFAARDGVDTEYLDSLVACYEIWSRHDLYPRAVSAPYHHDASHLVDPKMFEYLKGTVINLGRAADCEPQSAPSRRRWARYVKDRMRSRELLYARLVAELSWEGEQAELAADGSEQLMTAPASGIGL